MFSGLSQGTLQIIYSSLWWLHLITLYYFANELPYSKHFHVYTSLFNVFFAKLDPPGKLATMDLENVDEDTRWVRLVPRDTDSGFLRVELGFLDDTLHRMVFFDNLEQTTLVSLYDVAVNEPIDPARFEFMIPPDVDVVGTPFVAESLDP